MIRNSVGISVVITTTVEFGKQTSAKYVAPLWNWIVRYTRSRIIIQNWKFAEWMIQCKIFMTFEHKVDRVPWDTLMSLEFENNMKSKPDFCDWYLNLLVLKTGHARAEMTSIVYNVAIMQHSKLICILNDGRTKFKTKWHCRFARGGASPKKIWVQKLIEFWTKFWF